ncbi:uncharacterized protein LOC132708327 [Cylas formicarius]|uniref:uncharacterized protein LOC132708327 n=1 Tax=Cylas formicarius TaxID=197179 RepID=UPI002958D41A|nr:uncharacterized protein LOC132708327 [Cylas formicarius]
MGDFNGSTGKQQNSPIVGPYVEETINDNDERLIHLCETQNLKIKNGFFKHKNIHCYTWTQSTRNLKSIIDYVISRQKTNLQINDVRVLRGSTCGSDHYVVKAKISLHFRITRNLQRVLNNNVTSAETIVTPKYNFDSFRDESIVFLYQRRFDSKLLSPDGHTFDEIYENIITSLTEATQERKLRVQINKAKNESWDRKCEEINNYIGGRKCSEVWKFISTVKNPGKDKLDIQLIKPEQWLKNYKDLLRESRPEYLTESPRHFNVQGEEVEILEETIRKAVMNLKPGKSSGPEGIYSEMLKYGTHNLFRNLTIIINKCLNVHPVPKEFKVAFISSIHKKGKKNWTEITIGAFRLQAQ